MVLLGPVDKATLTAFVVITEGVVIVAIVVGSVEFIVFSYSIELIISVVAISSEEATVVKWVLGSTKEVILIITESGNDSCGKFRKSYDDYRFRNCVVHQSGSCCKVC
jgi:hypothetical protein